MNGAIQRVAWPANQPLTEVRFRVEFIAPTRDGLIEQLANFMGEEGYFVSKKVEWEKIGSFRKRMKLAHEALHKILASPQCPPVELHRGSARKQLLAINSNPVFEAFVVALRGKKPERAKGVRKKRRSPTIADGRPSRRKPENQLQRRRMAGPKRNYVS